MGRKTLADYSPAIQQQIVAALHPPKPVPSAVLAGPRYETAAGRESFRTVIMVDPMGKPRMTQRDKWAKRPNVVRYREYADILRAHYAGSLSPVSVSWTAYFTMPDNWSKKKKAAHLGKPHRAKPDRDNIDKGILDALFARDECVAAGTLRKFWDDGHGARIELEVSLS